MRIPEHEIKPWLLKAIPRAARYNTTSRPALIFGTGDSMVTSGEYTLISALYVEIDERIHRSLVEDALRALSREGRIRTFPESAQGDLSVHDRTLALRVARKFFPQQGCATGCGGGTV